MNLADPRGLIEAWRIDYNTVRRMAHAEQQKPAACCSRPPGPKLTTITQGTTTVAAAYDTADRRTSLTLTPVQELASGTPTANLLTGQGIDEYLVRTDAAGARHFLTDALGSTVALADGSGTVQTEYAYEPFGTVTTSGAGSSNPFGFTGRENDGTGLNYYRARYYDPRLQRFVGEDPIGFRAGDTNLHAYVFNAPLDFADPSGEIAVPLALCAAGAAGSAISDLLAGRKFSASGAAGWCAIGLGAGLLGPSIVGGAGIGLGSGAGLGGLGLGVTSGLVPVSRWGRAGLVPGDWVMRGPTSWWNYILSGKRQPGFGNQFAPYSSGQTHLVPPGSLSAPNEFPLLDLLKGLLGQESIVHEPHGFDIALYHRCVMHCGFNLHFGR